MDGSHAALDVLNLIQKRDFKSALDLLSKNITLWKNKNFVTDLAHTVNKSYGSVEDDVMNKFFDQILKECSVDQTIQISSELVRISCSHFLFKIIMTVLKEKVQTENMDEHCWDVLLYELPFQLEKRITQSEQQDLNFTVIDATLILDLYNSHMQLKSYRFPKLFQFILANCLKVPIDLRNFWLCSRERLGLHPVLITYENGKYLPKVYQKNYLVHEIVHNLSIYLQNFDDNRGDLHIPSVLNSFDLILQNMNRTFSEQNMAALELLVFTAFPYIQDFELENSRVEIMKKVEAVLRMCSSIPRVLIMKRLIERLTQVNKNIEGDCLLLAWILDHYKGYIDEPIFQDELGSLWSLIAPVRFEDIGAAAAYYCSVFNLAQSQALHKINKNILKNIRTCVLAPVREQINDFLRLKQAKEVLEVDKNSEEFMFQLSFDNQIDLLIFNLNSAESIVNSFLSS